MIEAICDVCGKRITFRYYPQGFETLPGWAVETQSFPTRDDLAYVVVCPDCNPKILKKGE